VLEFRIHSMLRALIKIIDAAALMLLDKVAFFNEDSYKVSACGFRHARPFCNGFRGKRKVKSIFVACEYQPEKGGCASSAFFSQVFVSVIKVFVLYDCVIVIAFLWHVSVDVHDFLVWHSVGHFFASFVIVIP